MNTVETQSGTLIEVTGFEDKGMHTLGNIVMSDLGLAKKVRISGCPWYRAWQHPDTHRARIRARIYEIPGYKLIIAHSYGGLQVLDAVCDDPPSDTYLVLIDAPLSSKVPVDIPGNKKIFWWFARQYHNRVMVAERCAAGVAQNGVRLNVLSIASPKDSIVPPDAKNMEGIDTATISAGGHLLYPKKIAEITIVIAKFVGNRCLDV